MLGVDRDQKSGGPWNASEALAFGASFAGTFMLNLVTTTKWPQLHQDRPGQMLALQFVVSALIYFALAVRANSDQRPYWKVREALAYLASCVTGFLVGFLFGFLPQLQGVHPWVALGSAIAAPVLAYFIVAYRPIGGSPGSTAPRVQLDSPASVTRHRPVVSHADCITTVPATSRNVTAAEWFLIHAGIELGPLARSELLAKASGGEIKADDLVKETGGRWTKAGDIGFLQEELRVRSGWEALEQIGRSQGIWVPKRIVQIGSLLFLAIVAFGVTWGIIQGKKVERTGPAKVEQEARSHARLGWDFMSKGDFENAIWHYSEAIRLEPKNAAHYGRRGYAWERKEDYEVAIRDYSEAIRLDPTDAEYYNHRGGLFQRKEDHDSAMRDYSEAIRLNPKDASYFSNRAWSWEQKKNYQSAIRDYGEAVRLAPGDNYNQQRLAWILATCPTKRLRDGQRAIQLAKRAGDLTGWKYFDDSSTIAAAYAETGQFQQAVRYQRKAIDQAAEAGLIELADEFRHTLERYKRQTPYWYDP